MYFVRFQQKYLHNSDNLLIGRRRKDKKKKKWKLLNELWISKNIYFDSSITSILTTYTLRIRRTRNTCYFLEWYGWCKQSLKGEIFHSVLISVPRVTVARQAISARGDEYCDTWQKYWDTWQKLIFLNVTEQMEIFPTIH